MRCHVKAVLSGHEHGTGGEHDRRVVEDVVDVECDEGSGNLFHERMSHRACHEIVADADWNSLGEDDLVLE